MSANGLLKLKELGYYPKLTINLKGFLEKILSKYFRLIKEDRICLSNLKLIKRKKLDCEYQININYN